MPLLDAQRALRDLLVMDREVRPPAWIRACDDAVGERLAVYRNTIVTAFIRALRLNFPTTERLVGREFFDAMAQTFARQELPATADLNAYGEGFPAFVRTFESCAALPYLADVARLDWAVATALNAPDAPPPALEMLAGLDDVHAAALRFAGQPALSLLESVFPIDLIWRGVLEQDEHAMAAIDLASGPVHLLVERASDAPRVVRLTLDEWRFAVALVAGKPVGELLTTFVNADVPALLAQHLIEQRLVLLEGEVPGGITP